MCNFIKEALTTAGIAVMVIYAVCFFWICRLFGVEVDE